MIHNRFNHDFSSLLQGFVPNKLAIAVSGGSDSVALLYLVSFWARQYKTELIIFSVNHNLRPESVCEIDYVESITKALGHEFYSLSWKYDGNKVGLQERARHGRYRLMTDKCYQISVQILLTAHHLDDNLETYLMRKNRNSGVFGLSSANSFFNSLIISLKD